MVYFLELWSKVLSKGSTAHIVCPTPPVEYDMASRSVNYDQCTGIRERGGRRELLKPPNLKTRWDPEVLWGRRSPNRLRNHNVDRSMVKSWPGQDHKTGLSPVWNLLVSPESHRTDAAILTYRSLEGIVELTCQLAWQEYEMETEQTFPNVYMIQMLLDIIIAAIPCPFSKSTSLQLSSQN